MMLLVPELVFGMNFSVVVAFYRLRSSTSTDIHNHDIEALTTKFPMMIDDVTIEPKYGLILFISF